ncbi:hypothetical protein CBA19CS11_22480 [Caballeronia novacaledonica]|uniref:hypothetical protein n=1 Tax=Caballeronia novacaledonica TaxID=1544861 RepID=UPI001EE270D9|nr:hypothetical protein [Caballeronia novacaledonica]GJH11656.1 hypothetical protein CBA19CS11_22480 [Caballeronia novacaledonica]
MLAAETHRSDLGDADKPSAARHIHDGALGVQGANRVRFRERGELLLGLKRSGDDDKNEQIAAIRTSRASSIVDRSAGGAVHRAAVAPVERDSGFADGAIGPDIGFSYMPLAF